MFVIAPLALLSSSAFAPACARCGDEPSHEAARPAAAKKKPEEPPPFVRPPEIPVELPKSKGVIFIVIDALRADGLGCYGYAKPTSPAIDALARESVLFESFHAASPWTSPSMGTLFTGVPPSIHRCGRAPRVWGKKQEVIAIDPNLPTLTSLLPEGVKTGAVVNNNFLDPELGFANGFDDYDYQVVTKEGYRDAAATTDAAIAWLEQHKSAPFFFYVHYFDAHMPYVPPEEYVSDFAPGERPELIENPFRSLAKARLRPFSFGSPEATYIRGLYDGEVRYTDDQLGRLFERMRKLGLFDDSWVIITADHGEEHFEHGGFEHGHRYEEEVSRVPLLVRAPGGKWHAGERVPYNASHVDLPPTILAMFGVRAPAHFEGRSLGSLMTGAEKAHREAGAEYNLFFDSGFAYTNGAYKLVMNLDRGTSFMYDLGADPNERNKLHEGAPEYDRVQERAKSLHTDWREKAKRSIAKAANLSDEARGALEALGYLEPTDGTKTTFLPKGIPMPRPVNPSE